MRMDLDAAQALEGFLDQVGGEDPHEILDAIRFWFDEKVTIIHNVGEGVLRDKTEQTVVHTYIEQKTSIVKIVAGDHARIEGLTIIGAQVNRRSE